MTRQEQITQVIPGYLLLPNIVQEEFEKTAPGKKLVKAIDEKLSHSNLFSTLKTIWNNTFQNKTQADLDPSFIEKLRKSLIFKKEYELLVVNIIYQILFEYFTDFHLLSEDEQFSLAETHCAHILYPCPTPNQMTQKITEFHARFLEDEKLALLRAKIARERPLVQQQARSNALDKLYNRYHASDDRASTSILIEETKQLQNFLLSTIKTIIDPKLQTHDLHNWHADYMLTVTLDILDRFDESGQFIAIDNWVHDYRRELIKYFEKKITTNPTTLFPTLSNIQQTSDLLSDIYTRAINSKKMQIFFDKLNEWADAHAFIQATGFATQNETSTLSWLDLYNYGRSKESIHEARHIINRLFIKPFLPLLHEYRQITYYEQNAAWQFIRTLMPILIITGVIIAVSAALTPFAISEAAFLFILIPTIYIGLMLASHYVTAKDYLYHSARQYYFGGRYEIPEYQVSERMLLGFKDIELAQSIRDFYVTEINRCYEIESDFQKKTPGTLSDEELQMRQAQFIRRDTLLLEWLEIHRGGKKMVGYDKIVDIARTRIQKEGIHCCTHLQTIWNDTSKAELTQWAMNVNEQFKTALHNRQEENSSPADFDDLPSQHPQRRTGLQFFTSVNNEPTVLLEQTKVQKLWEIQDTLNSIRIG
jgi:hypothetical protein